MRPFIILALAAAPAAAQVFAPLPNVPRLNVRPMLGTAPAETRIPMLETLDLTRLTPVVAPLGNKDYRVSIAPMRGDSASQKRAALPVLPAELVTGDAWAVTVVPADGKKFDVSDSWPFGALRRQPLEAELGGKTYVVSLLGGDDPAIRFQAKDAPLADLQVPLSVLKRAVWEQAAPVPAMGAEWRLAFSVDLWVGAGMRSFVFMRRLGDGSVDFYRTGAEAVDETREVPRQVGPLTVGLRIDDDARLVVTRR